MADKKTSEGSLETSVPVATSYGDHEHHAPSIDLFLRSEQKRRLLRRAQPH